MQPMSNEFFIQALNRIESHIARMADSNVEMAEKISFFMGQSQTDREALHKITGEHRDWLTRHDREFARLKSGDFQDSKKKGLT